jgi:hypothetical protein
MLTLAALAISLFAAQSELGKPVRLESDGQPIDTEIGHATPALYDWDGDGKRDLLVGQFGGGRMKVLRNIGKSQAPKFAALTWLEADGKVVTTPTG